MQQHLSKEALCEFECVPEKEAKGGATSGEEQPWLVSGAGDIMELRFQCKAAICMCNA